MEFVADSERLEVADPNEVEGVSERVVHVSLNVPVTVSSLEGDSDIVSSCEIESVAVARVLESVAEADTDTVRDCSCEYESPVSDGDAEPDAAIEIVCDTVGVSEMLTLLELVRSSDSEKDTVSVVDSLRVRAFVSDAVALAVVADGDTVCVLSAETVTELTPESDSDPVQRTSLRWQMQPGASPSRSACHRPWPFMTMTLSFFPVIAG
jgi:hypothetical protein